MSNLIHIKGRSPLLRDASKEAALFSLRMARVWIINASRLLPEIADGLEPMAETIDVFEKTYFRGEKDGNGKP